MTIKNIFDSIINFDLMNVVYFVGGIIVYLFPLGCVWFGGMILKDVLIDKLQAQLNEKEYSRKVMATAAKKRKQMTEKKIE